MLNLLVKSVWLLTEMHVQDVVGHEDWGLYSALLSLAFLFVAFADLGISPYTTRQIASQPDSLGAQFPALFALKLLLLLGFPAVVLSAGWLLGYRGPALGFLLLLCVVQGGLQLIQFFRSNFQAHQAFRTDSWLSVLDRALLLAATAVLLQTGLTISSFIWVRMAVVLLGIGLVYAQMSRSFGLLLPAFDRGKSLALLRAALPFATMTVLYSLHDKVDQVMLERLAGEHENGLYAGAYRWLDALSMYLWTVLPIFFARFAYVMEDRAEQERLLHFAQVVAAVPMGFVSVWVFFYGEYLLFPYTQSSPEDLEVMRRCLTALFAAALLNGIFAPFSTLLTATHHERYVNRMVLLSIAVNVALNFWLIPRYGAVASAWATVAGYATMDIAYVIYISRRLSIRVPWRQMGRIALALGLLALGMHLLSRSLLHWAAASALAGAAYLGICFALGLISLQQFRSFRT